MKSLAVIDILKFTLVGGLATEKPLQKQANHRKCSDLGGGGGGGVDNPIYFLYTECMAL